MNVEKKLQKEGIFVKEKVNTNTILNITENISKKITEKFPELELKEDEIFSKLSTLNMYKADMPEGMAEANYCYENSSIYFNTHINDEDLEEFGIHECLHFLQEVKKENKIKRMGLAKFNKFRTIGIGLNEAAVQYMAAKIIGVKPDYEKYYEIDIYTPSPSYYPMECALLNELIFFIDESILIKSTYYSMDDFKNEIIKITSKKTYNKILFAMDKIIKYEENIIILNNKKISTDKDKKVEEDIEKTRMKVNNLFLDTQNLIIKDFFDAEFKRITNLEELDKFRKKLSDFKNIVGISENDEFFENYYIERMSDLEHKSNVLENDGIETALEKTSTTGIFNLIINLFKRRNEHEDY